MVKLLEIQASVRQTGSISRSLSDEFVRAWKSINSHAEHLQRDLGINPPSHITESWVKANYTLRDERSPEMLAELSYSESLIEELLWADHLLLGVPMYNFCIPSALKAYLDNVVRVNCTFSFDPATYSFRGLATGRKALIITPSAGNFVVGSPLGSLNFCDTYLSSVMRFIGIEDVFVVSVPEQFMAEEIRQREIAAARRKLDDLVATW